MEMHSALEITILHSWDMISESQTSKKIRYSQLPLRWTHLGPALTVHLREVSTLVGDEVNDLSMAGTNSTCLL